ncbi:hypothetical protein BDR03DRAFT_968873 [Suillus americanus]|nr:hypothetical protein BDR03DRAFT_968873 [Suillus americanus]
MFHLSWIKVTSWHIFLGRRLGSSIPLRLLYSKPCGPRGPTSTHLLAYDAGRGRLISLTKHKFLLVCNSVLAVHSLPHISHHCFCIGGTTALLLRNIIKVIGRSGSSDPSRLLDHIAPLHAELLGPKLSPFLTCSSSTFRIYSLLSFLSRPSSSSFCMCLSSSSRSGACFIGS